METFEQLVYKYLTFKWSRLRSRQEQRVWVMMPFLFVLQSSEWHLETSCGEACVLIVFLLIVFLWSSLISWYKHKVGGRLLCWKRWKSQGARSLRQETTVNHETTYSDSVVMPSRWFNRSSSCNPDRWYRLWLICIFGTQAWQLP